MNIIKNYILWPVLGVTLTLAIYLILVLWLSNILKYLPTEKEEILWDFTSRNLIYYNEGQPELQDLVDKLPKNLLPTRYNRIKIMVIKDKQINAFSAPGGRIIFTTGLLEKIQDEHVLVFIIGHEIAHLIRRDHLYEFSKMTIAKLYGKIIGSNLVEELLMLIDSSKVKEIEFLADQYSLRIMKEFYGNSNGSEKFFEIILRQKANELGQSTTHPSIKERLERVKQFHEN